MKGFFILLLLTNILFLVWQQWFRADPVVNSPYGGISVINEGLPLLSELEPSKKPAARKADNKQPVVEKVAVGKIMPIDLGEVVAKKEQKTEKPQTVHYCYRSNEFESAEDAKSLQKNLEKTGLSSSEPTEIESQKTNFWVMLKPYESLKKANEAAKILSDKKLKDFFIVRSGQYENAISLGVYSTKLRADMRYKEVVALKARLRTPVIEALELPAKRYVLTLKFTEEEQKQLFENEISGELQKITCK